MKPKINEITVKYIECERCGFGKSCPYPEEIKTGRFYWFCSKCRHGWSGIIEENGEVFRIEASGRDYEDQRHVILVIDKSFNPWVMLAQRNAESEEEKTPSRPPETLYLLSSEELDVENNPKGFDVYRAVSFGASIRADKNRPVHSERV